MHMCVSVFSMMCNKTRINFSATIKLMFSCSSLTSAPFPFNFLAAAFNGLFFIFPVCLKPSYIQTLKL